MAKTIEQMSNAELIEHFKSKSKRIQQVTDPNNLGTLPEEIWMTGELIVLRGLDLPKIPERKVD